MKYEVAKRLKEAGWQGMGTVCALDHECFCDKKDCQLSMLGTPDLNELSRACRRQDWWLDIRYRPENERKHRWLARITNPKGEGEEIGAYGSDQEEALVNLYILLHEEEI